LETENVKETIPEKKAKKNLDIPTSVVEEIKMESEEMESKEEGFKIGPEKRCMGGDPS